MLETRARIPIRLIEEEIQMFPRVSKSVSRLLALACVVLVPLALGAQTMAKPAAKAAAGDTASKWDIFAGYSFFDPNSHVDGIYGPNCRAEVDDPTEYCAPPAVPGGKDPVDFKTEKIGSVVNVTRYFNDHWGLQIDSGQHDLYVNCENCFSNSSIVTLQAGAVYRWAERGSMITPWFHALGGGGSLEGPDHQGYTPGYTFTAGGGLDRALTPHWAFRAEGDYEFMHVDFGVPHNGTVGWQPGGVANLEGIRLAAGVVYHVGAMAPPPAVTLMCSAKPTVVFPGDPVTVTAMAGELEPKMNVVYSLSGAGVTSSTTTATVATAALAPGAYTVNCGVKEGKHGKEGLKVWESATASASFTVKQFEPPAIKCAVSPATILSGDTATVTATAVSPQNRPLTYNYTASDGSIQGSGNTAIFSSVGAPAGPVSIACTVTDDKGQSASATINAANTVTITVPYVAPPVSPEVNKLETRLALHSVFFPTAQPRINNPSGGLVASQQGTLTTLASDFKSYLEFKPDAHLILTGHADARGSVDYNKALSERRVASTKQFLVEKGVPETSIEVRGLGSEQGLTAGQVKELIEQNPDLSATERKKALHDLAAIVLAQNRRVDITLSTTGKQSVLQFPFNAADSLTLLGQQTPAPHKKAATAIKK
jgi:outer membrane protein OmpA-like peptidoglycan-associated protein